LTAVSIVVTTCALVGRVSSLNAPTSTPVESFVLARSSAATSCALGM
jgi:hypothetical protein